MPSLETSVSHSASHHTGAAIFILAVAAFVIVTTEYLIIGLLPALARDMAISISLAGQLLTLFAFTVMLFGPILTALLSHIDRKKLFIVILLIFAAANALAALAPNIWLLALARFIPALVLPVFWGTASETASKLAGPLHAGRAVSQVYLGISAALLFGIPLGNLASNTIGWRGSFWMLAVMSLLIALLIARFMPHTERSARLKIREQICLFKDPRFLTNVLLSIMVFTAMFTAYTYLADILERVAGIAPIHVAWWLMGFGAIGLLGNWLGGYFVSRHPLGASLVFVLLLAVGMTATISTANSPILLGLALSIWGISYTALFPICQVRVMQSASHAQALAGTVNVSAANAGTGLGAIIGGLAIPLWGLESIAYVATGIAMLAALMIVWMSRSKVH